MPHKQPAELIDAYIASLPQLRRLVTDLTLEQLWARPVPGKCSTLEVICHLVDSEQAWCHRMKRVIAEERPLLISYDESKFSCALNYHEQNLEQELARLEGMRQQMARILRSLPESAWIRVGIHSERGLMTLSEMLKSEVKHIPHHIRHIIDKRQVLGKPDFAK